MGCGGGYSLHGCIERVDTGTEVDGDVSEPSELTDAAVLELGLNKVVGGEVVGDTEGVKSIGSNVSIKVGGVGKPGEGLGFLSGEAGGDTACILT